MTIVITTVSNLLFSFSYLFSSPFYLQFANSIFIKKRLQLHNHYHLSTLLSHIMLLITWIALEIAFWLYLYNTKKRFQQYVKPKTSPTKNERQQLFWNCYHTIKHDTRKWFEGWFYIANSPHRAHPNFKDIHRDNVATW